MNELFSQAIALYQRGQLPEATAFCQSILRADPLNASAWNLCGIIALQQRSFDHARDFFAQAVAAQPQDPGLLFNLAMARHAMRDHTGAAEAYRKAIRLRPDYADAHMHLGIVLHEQRNLYSAIDSLDRAVALAPQSAAAHYNRANAARALKRFDLAEQGYRAALQLNPYHAKAHSSLGNLFMETGRAEPAMACFDRAIELDPRFAEARWNKSLLLLTRGQFEQAWPLFESRLDCEAFSPQLRHRNRPRWRGEDLPHRTTVLLYSEQGLGDTIQFSRYASLLARRGATVYLEVEQPLVNLLKTLDGVSGVFAKGDPLPPFDLQSPLMSMPSAFGTRLANIPSRDSYLRADPSRVDAWEKRLGSMSRPRIGLAWSGNPDQGNDVNRSVALGRLLRGLPRGFTYVSIQKQVREADRHALEQSGIPHFGCELVDFGDTAALCMAMEAVISVDTSVAHLSGALGLPTLVMLTKHADWRWMPEQKDSLWYPSMTLCRQSVQGHWESAFERVAMEMQRLGSI